MEYTCSLCASAVAEQISICKRWPARIWRDCRCLRQRSSFSSHYQLVRSRHLRNFQVLVSRDLAVARQLLFSSTVELPVVPVIIAIRR